MADFFKKFKEIEEQKQAKIGEKSDLEAMLEKNGNEPVVVLTYNRTEGYDTGIYGDGKLLLLKIKDCSYADQDAKKEIMEDYLRAFGLNDPLEIADKIKEVHVYIGKAERGKLGSVEAAAEIAGSPEKLNIYYCTCAKESLNAFREKFPEASFYKVECGGRDEMKNICKDIAKPEEKNG